jgi:hypothetical protein
MKQSEDDTMPKIATLFAAMCIAAAPTITTSKAFAQKEPDKLDKTDKADRADKATSKPEADKTNQLDLDKIMTGLKDKLDKTDKADRADKATSKPEVDKTNQLDLDKIMTGLKDMIEKGLKEEDKPAPAK